MSAMLTTSGKRLGSESLLEWNGKEVCQSRLIFCNFLLVAICFTVAWAVTLTKCSNFLLKAQIHSEHDTGQCLQYKINIILKSF